MYIILVLYVHHHGEGNVQMIKYASPLVRTSAKNKMDKWWQNFRDKTKERRGDQNLQPNQFIQFCVHHVLVCAHVCVRMEYSKAKGGKAKDAVRKVREAKDAVQKLGKAKDPKPPYSCVMERNFMKLDPADPDRTHMVGCPPQLDCPRCWWTVHKWAWEASLVVDVVDGIKGCWVDSVGNGDSWALKCRVCAAAKQTTQFATKGINVNIRLSIFLNHSKTASHQNALAVFGGLDPSTLDISEAPPKEHFITLLDAIRHSKATGNQGCIGVGGRTKCRKMKFCLAEAKRMTVRKALKEAIALAIHQDGRKGRLAIRFHTCNSKLQTFKGVLGSANLAKDFALNAVGMRNATLDIIKKISTPVAHIPYREKNTEVDEDTFLNIFDKLELFDADAAEDETLTGKLLRGDRQAGDGNQAYDAIFKNLKVCNRDKPHASRRTHSQSRA